MATNAVRFATWNGGPVVFAVPLGRRAVIKCVTGYNGTPALAGIFAKAIRAGGAKSLLLYQLVPSGNGIQATDLHVVVNGGESIEFAGDPGCEAQASGYLLYE